MIPAVGTILKFVGSAFKIPAKAFQVTAKGSKNLAAKIKAAASSHDPEERGSLLGMIGRATDPSKNSRKLWNALNKGFVSKITDPLPSTKFIKPANLINKTTGDYYREGARNLLGRTQAKEELRRQKDTREKRRERKEYYGENTKHQDLKERWKQDRRQRNGELRFEETYSPNLERQQDIENRQLQDYYDVLLNQNASEIDKIRAEYRHEQEKLDHKYEQLNILQESLTAIQKNFGRLAYYNENSFDAVQEQIATSAEIADNKQSYYNDNISSDLELLQNTNESNTEFLVDVIHEGHQLQEETLNQLNAIEENGLLRDQQLSEALDSIEQQQRERHVQQMYVLDNIGAKVIAVEQQQRAQKTEQAYIYDKFNKKQQKTQDSLFNMMMGGIMGLLSSFMNALANPQRIVETMAETAGSFVAELLSVVQFVFANTVYGLGHMYAWTAKPLRAILSKFFDEDRVNGWLPDQEKLNDYMKIVDWLPNHIGMGMPNMVILPMPDMSGEMAGLFDRGLQNLMKAPLETIAQLPEKAYNDIKTSFEEDGFFKGVRKVASYAIPLTSIPMLPIMPWMAPAIATRIITTAGMPMPAKFEEQKAELAAQKAMEQANNLVMGSLPKQKATAALPPSQEELTAQGTIQPKAKVPTIDVVDVKAIEKNAYMSGIEKSKEIKEKKIDKVKEDFGRTDDAFHYIDNSTTNNIFNTYVRQRDKQFASGV